jgi:hypothetical protein
MLWSSYFFIHGLFFFTMDVRGGSVLRKTRGANIFLFGPNNLYTTMTRKMILHFDVSVHVLRFDVLIQVTTTGDGWAYELYVLEGGRLLFKQRFDSL